MPALVYVKPTCAIKHNRAAFKHKPAGLRIELPQSAGPWWQWGLAHTRAALGPPQSGADPEQSCLY